ncbi:hypothetical protein ACOME3_003397 [Neoechinorhynchus agilis]
MNNSNELAVTLMYELTSLSCKPARIEILLNSRYLDFRSNGMTPLHYAVRNSLYEEVQLLISLGADLSAQDHAGRDVLHYAASNNDCELGRLLLVSGAQIDSLDNNGNTPLKTAIIYGNHEFASFLINRGASKLGMRKFATRYRDKKMATVLKKAKRLDPLWLLQLIDHVKVHSASLVLKAENLHDIFMRMDPTSTGFVRLKDIESLLETEQFYLGEKEINELMTRFGKGSHDFDYSLLLKTAASSSKLFGKKKRARKLRKRKRSKARMKSTLRIPIPTRSEQDIEKVTYIAEVKDYDTNLEILNRTDLDTAIASLLMPRNLR